MHRLLLALLALGSLSLSASASVVATVQRTLPAVVSIDTVRRSSWGRKEIVGAGVIVDARGYLLTARHVITGADSIVVSLFDGTRITGPHVEAEDTRNDLAIVTFSTPKLLQAIAPDTSRKPFLGETVITIGHPFSFLYSVSRGIVGGLERVIELKDGGTLKHMIQTDAAIDGGSSGGPLVTADGRWIGLVTAVHENANTMGFAVPAEPIAAFLKRHLPR